MLKKIWNLYKKYEELVNYVIAGGLATLVNIGVFALCRAFDLALEPSNVVAWIITVLFVYVTNKFFVFKTKTDKKSSAREFVLFILARLFSLVVEIYFLKLCVEVLALPELASKIASQAVVIILNYVLSKLVVFKPAEAR